MIIQVNQDLCAGNGVCVEACPVGAIQLVDQRAVIYDALCTQCEACLDACPSEAITARSILKPSVSIMTLPAAESRPVPVRDQAALPETATPARGLAPLAGAALAFLGREVAPRLADALVAALERRLARSPTTTITPASSFSRRPTAKSGGERRQARYRCGRLSFRTGNRNHKERR
jgi:NAD-dependent dihydropyrimidine dehydrogenase PreA subunit